MTDSAFIALYFPMWHGAVQRGFGRCAWRRAAMLAMITASGVALPAAYAVAQPYPAKAVRIEVGQAPGAQNDVMGRILAQALSEYWKQNVVVENHGGAGGTVGAALVAAAPPDGYRLLLAGVNNLAIAPALYRNLAYHPLNDFAPIGGLARVPYGLAVNARVPARSLPELIAYARANPGRLTYASGGTGSSSSLAAEMLKSRAAIDLLHIAYKGSAPAINALIGGEVDVMFADLSLLAAHDKAGTVRVLAVAGAKRAAAFPQLATVAEQGVPGFALEPWYGLVAPAGLAPDVMARLVAALAAVTRSPGMREKLERLGYEPMADTPGQFEALIRSEAERFAGLIRSAGISGEP
jgi:tripartite-type tricarboxylate transporter receptor subunit TctC